MAGFFLLAHTLTRLAGNWILAEAVILAAALLASRLLPGTACLWLLLLGTVGTLPVLWALLPPSMFFTADFWPLALLFYSFTSFSARPSPRWAPCCCCCWCRAPACRRRRLVTLTGFRPIFLHCWRWRRML